MPTRPKGERFKGAGGFSKRSTKRIARNRSYLSQAARSANVSMDEQERLFLRFISEQTAVQTSQLCTAFNVYRADMKRFVAELEARGLVESKRFITGDDVWVWLGKEGIKQACTGFRYRRPHYRNLAHWGAITDVRIALERRFDGIEWVCERSLLQGRPRGYMPDAVVVHRVSTELGTVRELRYAIEVELSPKPPRELEEKISASEERYDSIIYFASPRICRKFAALDLAARHPKVRLVEVPAVSRYLDQPAWRLPGDPEPLARGKRLDYEGVDLSALDLEIVDLIAEQGEVPMDQLEAFFDLGSEEADRLVSRLVRARVVMRAKPLIDEPPWLWVGRLGAKLTRTGLPLIRPSLSRLESRRAANQVRLLLTKGKPEAKWVSGRALEQSRARRGKAPDGALHVAGNVHAVDICQSVLRSRRYGELLARRFEEGYDGAVWFYTQRSAWAVRAFWEGLSAKYQQCLAIRPLPSGEHLPMAPKAKDVRRRSSPKPTLIEELVRRPVRLRRMPVEILRSGCVQALARETPGDGAPIALEAWVELGSRGVRWVLTEEGFFRVVQFGQWTQVDRIEREDAFIKDEGSPIRPQAEMREQEPVAKRYEIDDRVWALVEAQIPPARRRKLNSKGAWPLSDRAVLSGAVWSLRNGVRVKEVPPALGFGSGLLIYRRLRELESAQLWEGIKRVLACELPDGKKLDWSRLDSITNQRKAAKRAEPEMDDRVWGLIQRVLDEADGLAGKGGTLRWVSDQTALSAAIWRLRKKVGWYAVNRSGHCCETTAHRRIRDWQRAGAWKEIRSILEAELPDGAELEWWRLEDASPA